MKKFFIYILTAVIAVTSFAFPAYADSEPSYDVDTLFAEAMEKYNEFMQDTEDSSVKEINDMLSLPYHCFIVYQDRSYKYLTIISSIYKDISYSSDESVVRGTELFYTYFEWDDISSFGCRYSVTNKGSSIPSNSTGRHMPVEAFLKNSNFNLTYNGEEYTAFNINNPPDVFTYSIDKPGFSLSNSGENSLVTVDIRYTDEYISWINKADEALGHGTAEFSYNFVVYVSPVKPTDTDSLLSSMRNVNYINLNYSEYVYEGGAGSPVLNDEADSSAPASQSGKSPWTLAQGVNIVNLVQPWYDLDTHKYIQSTFSIPVRTENIKGFDEENPNLYFLVLGCHGNVVQPNKFNFHNIETDLTGHNTPNDTFSEYFITHSEAENETPDITFHNYYFPFECVDNAWGHGTQSTCTYKPQIVNGKEYDTFGGSISSYTNKALTPDLLHDEDMDNGQWVKPEDYAKWQNDFYSNKKYNSEFSFNTQTLKDIFDTEGDFFKFVTVSFKVLPDYVTNIFVAFIIASFAIVIFKRLL